MSASSALAAEQPASGSLLDTVADVVEARSGEAVEEGWPSEWEVVYVGGLVNIRKHNNTGSEVVGVVRAGTVVLGFDRGHWLKLSGIDGYMEIRLDSSGYLGGEDTELMRKREVTYLMADGECDEENAYDIPDQAICKHAARWLGQPKEALWFNDGCQVDPTKHVATSSAKKPGEEEEEEKEDDDDDDEGEDGKENEEEEEEPIWQTEEKDDAKDASADDAPELSTEKPGEDEGEEPKEELIKADWGVAAEDTAQAPEDQAKNEEKLAGRRLKSGKAPPGGHHKALAEASDPAEKSRQPAESESPPNDQSGGESWEQYAKRNNFVRVCSTALYDPLMPFPVQTHTSVTSVTTTTTQTTTTTVSIFHPWGSPSLFCFAVFRAHSKEQELIQEACRMQVSIFACDTTLTVSGEKVLVGKDYKQRDVWSWVSKVDDVQMGDMAKHPDETTNSWLNTKIFINSIKKIVESGVLWDHDWIVKADPDAVIFPERVREHIIGSESTGTAAFYKNCVHDGKWWLYGSIEMFSKEAMQLYRDFGQKKCEKGMQWEGWGEDMYMAECMQKMGATEVHSQSVVADDYCNPRDCTDQQVAAFHPYKTLVEWRRCYYESLTGKKEN